MSMALVAISSMAKGSDGKSSIGSISRGSASLDYSSDIYFLAEAGDSQDPRSGRSSGAAKRTGVGGWWI